MSSSGTVFMQRLSALIGPGLITVIRTSSHWSGSCKNKFVWFCSYIYGWGHTLLWTPHLRFVADQDVVLHGKGNVVHRELQEGTLWDIDQADTCPGGRAVVRVGPWNDSHSLQEWNETRELKRLNGALVLSSGGHICVAYTPLKPRSSIVIKRSEVKGQTVTYRSKLGLLGLIRVVIQTDEVKSRLHLIAAPTEHVISADTLTAHLITPVGRQEVVKKQAEGNLLCQDHEGNLITR